MNSGFVPGADQAHVTIPLHADEVSVSTRKVETGTVRVAMTTTRRDHEIEEQLTCQSVEVERVPIGRYVDAVPPIREEGDVTIMPVVEEVVVVERRLLLREEVRVRQVKTTRQHVETVTLREQDVVVTRLPSEQSPPQPEPLSTNSGDER